MRGSPEEVRTRAVGVVVPVHNEEERLGDTLRALEASLAGVAQLQRHVAIVLDACRDESVAIAERWRRSARCDSGVEVTLVACDAGNVGVARATGCDILVRELGEFSSTNVWLATTDADSRVPPEWLPTQVAQHNSGADAWAGRVAVTDWSLHRRHIASLWQKMYDAERHPIHGASLGFNAAWYKLVGGFPPRKTGEDRGLCDALRNGGAVMHYDSTLRVITSARRRARAPEGFAAALTRIEALIVASAS